MAHASQSVIDLLRRTADRIARSDDYQWGHMGACNCGHLAQDITKLSKGEIHRYAMQGDGDWSDQLEAFCPSSGLDFDAIIGEMLQFGFVTSDLRSLEWLDDPAILASLPMPMRLRRNIREDVAVYLFAWADLLEKERKSRDESAQFAPFSAQKAAEKTPFPAEKAALAAA